MTPFLAELILICLLFTLIICIWLVHSKNESKKKYLVVRQITQAQRSRLKAAHFSFYDEDLQSEPSISFRAGALPHFLQLLDGKLVGSYEIPEKPDREAVICFDSPSTRFSARTEGKRPGRHIKALLPLIASQLCDNVKSDIILHVAPTTAASTPDDGHFHIFWRSPQNGAEQTVPKHIWNIPTASLHKKSAAAATDDGILIIDRSTDFVLGELHHNALYINLDLGKLPEALFVRLLQQTVIERALQGSLEKVRAKLDLNDENKTKSGSAVQFAYVSPAQIDTYTEQLLGSILGPCTATTIVVHSRIYDSPSGYVKDGELHVFLDSADSLHSGRIEGRKAHKPHRVFDVNLNNNVLELWRWPQGGKAIIDQSSNLIIGSILNNAVFLHFDPKRLDVDIRLPILAQALLAARDELEPTRLVDKAAKQICGRDLTVIDTRQLGSVEIDAANHQNWEPIGYLCQKLLVPLVKKSVAVHCRIGQQPPVDDGRFHVFICSTPQNFMRNSNGPPLWDLAFTDHTPTCLPSGTGTLICDNHGMPVGELLPNNLYILRSLSQFRPQQFITLLTHIMLALEEQIQVDTTPVRVETLARQLTQQCQKALRRSQAKFNPKQITASPSIDELRTRVENSRAAKLIELRANTVKDLGQEFDRLWEIDGVQEISMNDGWLIVNTDELTCVDPRSGIRHKIGAFKIMVPLANPKKKVLWFNQTRTVHGMQAPHIERNGYGCLGNIATLLEELLEKHDFSTTVELALEFASSVNVNDSWGAKISDWPEDK